MTDLGDSKPGYDAATTGSEGEARYNIQVGPADHMHTASHVHTLCVTRSTDRRDKPCAVLPPCGEQIGPAGRGSPASIRVLRLFIHLLMRASALHGPSRADAGVERLMFPEMTTPSTDYVVKVGRQTGRQAEEPCRHASSRLHGPQTSLESD